MHHEATIHASVELEAAFDRRIKYGDLKVGNGRSCADALADIAAIAAETSRAVSIKTPDVIIDAYIAADFDVSWAKLLLATTGGVPEHVRHYPVAESPVYCTE